MKRIAMLLAFAFLLGLSGTAEGKYVLEKDTLSGIKKLFVVVEELNEKAKENGLSEATIQTNTELALRMAGIEVASSDDPKKYGLPYLYVKVNVKYYYPSSAFSILVSLEQIVMLPVGNTAYAAIWINNTVGTCGAKSLDSIHDSIKEMVDVFLNDYLAVNPKK